MKAVGRVGAVAGGPQESGHKRTRRAVRLVGSLVVAIVVMGGGALLLPASAEASTAATTVIDAATSAPWSGGEVTGATAYDTMTLTGDGVATPTGTVLYSLFGPGDGACATTASSTQTVDVEASGGVPNSATTSPLGAGTYSYEASYSGDSDNAAASSCTSFTVGRVAPTLNVVVDSGSVAWTGSEPVGSSASGAASFSGAVAGVAPTGSVTYSFYGPSDGSCGTAPFLTVPETISGGSVPPSSATAGLGAGTYSLKASYSGDTNYGGVASACESFSVGQNTVSMPTVVKDANGGAPWSGVEVTGASAYDTAAFTNPIAGFTPTGGVTYSLFGNGLCQGGALSQSSVSVNGGSVPDGGASSPLGAGSYSYQAVYHGDTNYAPVTSVCESFQVLKATPLVSTTVYDAGTGSPWSASEVTGASAYDTGTVAGSSAPGLAPTGSATYAFFSTGLCGGSASSQPPVGVSGGTLGRSETAGPLNKGSYSFEASYGGDGNYNPTVGTCEPFNVGIATPSAPTVSNVPTSPTEFESFVAQVSTNGDGPTSVTSSTPSVCTVGSDSHTVTFVLYGSCTLTALVDTGSNFGAAAGAPRTFSVQAAPRGYWLVGSDGGIFSFGAAQFHGSMGGTPLQRPVVGITPTADRNGYWLVASDGGVFAFGDSSYYGSLPGLGLHPAGSGQPHSLNAPVVGIVPSSTGHGYFMVASDGGVFAFGDARFAGSCPGIGGCAGTAVAVLPDHSGNGYWLVTSSGAVYAFGDAGYYGASGPFGVAATDAIATPDGHGYWILYANGSVLSFGDASPLGSPVGYVNSYNPATAIFPTADGHGYWVTSTRGDVFSYGNAPFLGGMAATNLNGAIIAAFGF